MLTGRLAALRERLPGDVAVLHNELYNDVATRARADARPWRPRSADNDSPYAVPDGDDGSAAIFSVLQRSDDALAGEALLWQIDTHNRGAHLGISLLPESRGRGLGTDVVRVLCRYGFGILGLHRLQLETLTDNAAMIAVAETAGFVSEGVRRDAAWVDGQFADEAWFGLLAGDWRFDAGD